MNKLRIDHSWTLFLDRDGVINRRIPDTYISNILDFEFSPGVLEVLTDFSKIFLHLIVVTNQQGIGRGLLTNNELESVHDFMVSEIFNAGGCIDGVYFCGDLAKQPGNCRKPSPIMAYKAQEDYPDIEFEKSIMVGDSIADVDFGQKLGMKTVLVGEQLGYPDEESGIEPDYVLKDLVAVKSILV